MSSIQWSLLVRYTAVFGSHTSWQCSGGPAVSSLAWPRPRVGLASSTLVRARTRRPPRAAAHVAKPGRGARSRAELAAWPRPAKPATPGLRLACPISPRCACVWGVLYFITAKSTNKPKAKVFACVLRVLRVPHATCVCVCVVCAVRCFRVVAYAHV